MKIEKAEGGGGRKGKREKESEPFVLAEHVLMHSDSHTLIYHSTPTNPLFINMLIPYERKNI